jgi:hypothetical protein
MSVAQKKILHSQIDKDMALARNLTLAVLVVAITLGVFYMIDPTFYGLLRSKRHEGFAIGDEVTYTNAPAPMNGEYAGNFVNAHINSEDGETVSPMTPNRPTEGFQNLNPSPMPFAGAERPANCYPKNQLAPQELLPNDPNSKWAQVNPMAAGDIAGKNFLNAGALIGVNTVGQSLRNSSWDLRSEPPNPQVVVSPWLQSTIEPELSRRPLEIA